MENNSNRYDVVIVGGGASGTALLYTLARYTDIPRIALLEKYDKLGTVNSAPSNNSQTLHVGDIETNYSIEKARDVQSASMMIKRYTDALPENERIEIIRTVQKMLLAVGNDEVGAMNKRYEQLRKIFPTLQKLDASGITEVEPEVMRNRDPHEQVLAFFEKNGYAVDFAALAHSFVLYAVRDGIDVRMSHNVVRVECTADGHILHTMHGATITAHVVIFDTDAYSLGFAKSLGYGKEFSLIPIAGSFYFTSELLRGKVYTVQKPRMPFAAVHGDTDLTRAGFTRWGPTARFYPVLEAGKISTMIDFFKASGGLRWQTYASFVSILLEPIRFVYLVRNFFYDLPIIGVYFFASQVRKIVPSVRGRDIRRAKGYGGMRLQRVDTKTRELLLGEGKIIGDNVIFNMTPSPGASVCLYNAMRDAETIAGFFAEQYIFRKDNMLADLCTEPITEIAGDDVSLRESYPS
jgi:malate dehydrogenase (quinone)